MTFKTPEAYENYKKHIHHLDHPCVMALITHEKNKPFLLVNNLINDFLNDSINCENTLLKLVSKIYGEEAGKEVKEMAVFFEKEFNSEGMVSEKTTIH